MSSDDKLDLGLPVAGAPIVQDLVAEVFPPIVKPRPVLPRAYYDDYYEQQACLRNRSKEQPR
jgi:hypothetical protein